MFFLCNVRISNVTIFDTDFNLLFKMWYWVWSRLVSLGADSNYKCNFCYWHVHRKLHPISQISQSFHWKFQSTRYHCQRCKHKSMVKCVEVQPPPPPPPHTHTHTRNETQRCYNMGGGGLLKIKLGIVIVVSL
jgi:hypothetical protein